MSVDTQLHYREVKRATRVVDEPPHEEENGCCGGDRRFIQSAAKIFAVALAVPSVAGGRGVGGERASESG